MTTKKTVLVRYSMCIDGIGKQEELQYRAKFALAELFTGFARTLMSHEDIDVTKDHEIELSSVQEHWDQKFVLKLIRIKHDKNSDQTKETNSQP